MLTPLETPSWLTSWVAWRNHYTKPGDIPFTILIEELKTGSFLGLSLAWNTQHSTCPYCNDLGVVQHNDLGIIYCLCQVLSFQERAYFRYRDYQSDVLPARLADIEYTTSIGTSGIKTLKRAVSEATRFINSPDTWLLFSGTQGTGKTHILSSIATQFYPMSLYMASRDLEDLIHAYRKEDNLGELYSVLRYAPVLLMDDLGMEYGGKLMGSFVDRVIDARYSRFPDYPVVSATNLLPIELPQYLPRTADRFNDVRKVVRLPLTGTSYRVVGGD